MTRKEIIKKLKEYEITNINEFKDTIKDNSVVLICAYNTKIEAVFTGIYELEQYLLDSYYDCLDIDDKIKFYIDEVSLINDLRQDYTIIGEY